MRPFLVEKLSTAQASQRLIGAVGKDKDGAGKGGKWLYYVGRRKAWCRASSAGPGIIKLEWFKDCPICS